MIDPANVALFIPPGLRTFKLDLFERVGKRLGHVVRGDHMRLVDLPQHIIPAVGCTPELKPIIEGWRYTNRPFIYWDRGYARRVFATWLPRGENGGYYRWHLNSFQLQSLRIGIKKDRWELLQTPLREWSKLGKHIVIAEPTRTYAKFHGIEGWTAKTVDQLSRLTKRQLVIRNKESLRPLQDDLRDAHCLVAHASVAAVEAVILGCPVFVDRSSAAALVGCTDLAQLENPIYPNRVPWVNSLAYSQFNEQELVDGTLWRLIE